MPSTQHSSKYSKPWCKVLYEKQGFPDNYVDTTFLSDLRHNTTHQKHSPLECLSACGRVTQEICLCSICAVVFIFLDHSLSPMFPVAIMTSTLALSAVALFIWDPKAMPGLFRNASVFLLFGYGFSPILKNLTETISTDTIYAMVTFMTLVHLFVQDYGTSSSIVSSTLSFNASLFGVVCLASRLKTILHAFTLLTFSAVIFAAAPFMHHLTMQYPHHFQFLLTFTLSATAVSLVALISTVASCLLLIMMLFLNGIFPLFFLYFQSFKASISGPWDEAIVDEHENTKRT